MHRCVLVLCLLLALAWATPVFADGLTCGATCHNPTSITSTINGDLKATFFYKDANFYDYIRLINTTANTTGDWMLGNQTSQRNDRATLGTVSIGDNLVIQLCVVPDWEPDHSCKVTDAIFATDPRYSSDGANHAVVGAPTYPQSPFNLSPVWTIWMEDFDKSLWGLPGEPDFNDYVFWLQFNVSVTCDPGCGSYGPDALSGEVATPEPASLLLLGSGLVGAFCRGRRMLQG